jgi:hypothetical protein
MTNQSVAYILVAVVVGFTLISAVPGQIEMFTTHQQTLSIEGGETLTVETGENDTIGQEIWFDKVNESGRGGPWNLSESGQAFEPPEDIDIESEVTAELDEGVKDLNTEIAAETAEAARDDASGMTRAHMASWWIIDVLVAFGVYLWAKKRLG